MIGNGAVGGCRCFTDYWTKDECKSYREAGRDGSALVRSFGTFSTRKGLGSGALLYIVTTIEGALYLVGRFEIETIHHRTEHEKANSPFRTQNEEAHAKAGTGTPMRFDRRVSDALTLSLEFESRSHPKLKFDRPGHLDNQTLRTSRKLTPQSAAALDKLIFESDGAKFALT